MLLQIITTSVLHNKLQSKLVAQNLTIYARLITAIQVRTHTKAGAENTTEFYPVEYVFSDDERLDSRMFGSPSPLGTAKYT